MGELEGSEGTSGVRGFGRIRGASRLCGGWAGWSMGCRMRAVHFGVGQRARGLKIAGCQGEGVVGKVQGQGWDQWLGFSQPQGWARNCTNVYLHQSRQTQLS